MKKILFLLPLLTILFSANVFADGEDEPEQVPVEGGWGDDRIRTLVPTRPVVYINGDVLSIYLADPLADLAVVITDSDGTIVYQGSISSTQPGYTYRITLPDDTEGVYSITLSHQRYGSLTGWI